MSWPATTVALLKLLSRLLADSDVVLDAHHALTVGTIGA